MSETPNAKNPLENALKQIQEWFVQGDYAKVKQGCQEVLEVSPNNSIAQDLLKKAIDALKTGGRTSEQPSLNTETPPASDIPTPPAQSAESKAEPQTDSTPITPPSLIQEPTSTDASAGTTPPSEPMPAPKTDTPKDTTFSIGNEAPIPADPASSPQPGPIEDEPKVHHLKSVLINVGILIGIILLGIALVYGYSTFKDRGADDTTDNDTPTVVETPDEDLDDTDDEVIDDDSDEIADTTDDVDYDTSDARNQKRSDDLSAMEQALIAYYDDYKKYPTAETINTVLVEEGYLTEIPLGPNENEVYLYAVYSNDIGPEQLFILSAGFENEDGSISAWTTGASPLEYTDYDVIDGEHVTILHPTLSEEDYLDLLFEEAMDDVADELSEEDETDDTDTPEENDEPTRIPRT